VKPALRQILLCGGAHIATVTVTNNVASEFTDLPVRVAVTWLLGMRQDFGDLRFFSGGYPIPYCILPGGKTDGVSADVWVKVPSLPSSGSVLLTMTYGPSRRSASDGASVFSFFDDFSSGAISSTRWTSPAAPGNTSSVQVRNIGYDYQCTGAGGGQGLVYNGANFYFAANNGNGVDSTIYKLNPSTGATVASFAGSPHAANLDFRLDTGNLISDSGGDTVSYEVREMQTDGTLVRSWDFSALATSSGYTGNGAVACYAGPGQLYVLMSATVSPFAFKAYLVNIADDGSYTTAAGPYASTGQGRLQGMTFFKGALYILADNLTSASLGQVFSLELSGATASATLYCDRMHGQEKEGLCNYNGSMYFGNGDKNIYKITDEGAPALRVAAVTVSTAAYLKTADTISAPAIAGYVCKFSGLYPGVWLADTGGTPPDDAANNLGIGRLSAADNALRGRQRKASVQTQQTYTELTHQSRHRYEIKWDGANVVYLQDGSALGASTASNVPAGPLSLMFGGITGADARGFSGDLYAAYIRQYIATEPTVLVSAP
jgi:hypothetical protein